MFAYFPTYSRIFLFLYLFPFSLLPLLSHFFLLHFRGVWDSGENCVPHGQRRTLRGMEGRSAWPPCAKTRTNRDIVRIQRWSTQWISSIDKVDLSLVPRWSSSAIMCAFSPVLARLPEFTCWLHQMDHSCSRSFGQRRRVSL